MQTNDPFRDEIAKRHKKLFDLLREGEVKATPIDSLTPSKPAPQTETDMMSRFQREALASLGLTKGV